MLNRILLTTDAVGGIWCYSIELARALAVRGVEVVLAVLGPEPNPAQRHEADAIASLRLVLTGLSLDWLADSPEQINFAAEVLAAVAWQVDADTVHLHAPALMGRTTWPVPVVAVAHSCVGTWWRAVRGGALPSDLAWRAEATAHGIERADLVVVPSVSFATALRSCYGIVRPIEVVLNGRTAIDSKAIRRAEALTAGRLWDEGKNVAALDAAARKLKWPVLAAGAATGPNGAQVKFDHLRVLGSLDSSTLATHYAQASVFVSLARYEPFGLTVLEAAQAGCALLLSDIPSFRELWDGAAIFVPIDAPEQTAGAMADLLGRAEICAFWGVRASQRAASFTVQQMTNATLELHDRLTVQAMTAA